VFVLAEKENKRNTLEDGIIMATLSDEVEATGG